MPVKKTILFGSAAIEDLKIELAQFVRDERAIFLLVDENTKQYCLPVLKAKMGKKI